MSSRKDGHRGLEFGGVLRKRGSLMKSTDYLSEETLLKKAVGLLMDKLSPVETSRFVNLAARKRTDSVKRSWQAELKKNEFFAKVFVP